MYVQVALCSPLGGVERDAPIFAPVFPGFADGGGPIRRTLFRGHVGKLLRSIAVEARQRQPAIRLVRVHVADEEERDVCGMFLGLFAAFLLGWILLNTKQGPEWDPYPFILLNLLLSCLAAMQAPIIMMSQNRQASKDRQAAQRDYEVNLKSEMELMSLHTKLDEAREVQWKTLLQMQQSQMDILDRLETRLTSLEKRA